MWMIWAYLIGLVLLFFVWVYGEYARRQRLRIVCLLLMLPLLAMAPFGLGQFSGSARTSMAASGAVDRFLDAVVEQLDAQREKPLHDELRHLSRTLDGTYESVAFAKQIDAATARLNALQPTAAQNQE